MLFINSSNSMLSSADVLLPTEDSVLSPDDELTVFSEDDVIAAGLSSEADVDAAEEVSVTVT